MAATNTYEVEVEESEEGPEEPLRERFATCAARRLSKLEEREGSYPTAGGEFDILDAFEGPFVWEMTDEQLEATPPTSVILEVVSVDPAERPATPSTVRVTVRVPV